MTVCITKGQKRFVNHPFYCHVSAAEKIHGEQAQGKSSLFLIYIKKVSTITCEQEIMTGE